jgi:periplasmic divalent cation tolerance protein
VQDFKQLDILIVTTTVGSRADGEGLAKAIIERRLAACVQVEGPIQSHYRWQGKVCEEAEFRLVIKTLPGCAAALQALLAEQHPYEVPQFVAWPAGASEAYTAWARGEVNLPQA